MASRTNAVVRRRHSKEPESRTFISVLMSIVGTVLAIMVLAMVSLGGRAPPPSSLPARMVA